MNLFTQQNFTIVRQIPDHTDSTTYYVRAVVRNAYTDTILATLNLDDKTGQRFKKDWRVPADPSGEGFYVSIITSVYTDSAYTTKSASYGDDENTYLVIDRKTSGGGSSVGGVYGGPSLRDIRDVIKEEIEKRKAKPFNIPEVKKKKKKEYEMRWDDILKAIKTLERSIADLPQEMIVLEPVIDAIREVEGKIDSIEIPKLDLSPIEVQMKKDRKQNSIQNERIISLLKTFIKEFGTKVKQTFKDAFNDANFITSSVTFIGDKKPMMHKLELGEEKLPEKTTKSKFNINNLSI